MLITYIIIPMFIFKMHMQKKTVVLSDGTRVNNLMVVNKVCKSEQDLIYIYI